MVAALHRDGRLDRDDFASLLALFATLSAETEAEQGRILADWAVMIESGGAKV